MRRVSLQSNDGPSRWWYTPVTCKDTRGWCWTFMNFLNMFKPTKRGVTVQSMFWYALNHPEIPRDNWMILDASYETEPSFGQDPCVDDLLEDILQSGLNKTHLHFFQDSCWRPKSQGRAFCMVIYGNTASQNKIALGGWKSPHEKNDPRDPWSDWWVKAKEHQAVVNTSTRPRILET